MSQQPNHFQDNLDPLYREIVHAAKTLARVRKAYENDPSSADHQIDLINAQNALIKLNDRALKTWSNERDFALQVQARERIARAMDQGERDLLSKLTQLITDPTSRTR
jgi:hypothetical protein